MYVQYRSYFTVVWKSALALVPFVGLGTKPASLDPGGNTFSQPASGTASGEGNPHYLIGYQTKSVKPFGGGGGVGGNP